MPRPPLSRRVHGPPRFLSFKPAGIPRRQLDHVLLRVDQFEALRLADYEGRDQADAAREMGISPATFSRLIASARYAIVQTIVEGKALQIEGGNVELLNTLHRCGACGDEALVELPLASDHAQAECPSCLACGSENIQDLAALLQR